MRKPRCYIVNDKKYDTSQAEVYGDVIVLYQERPRDVFSTSRRAFEMKEKLRGMESSDYLVCAGNMILVLLAFGIIYEKFGFVNLLLFDVINSTYTARVVPKHQLQGGNSE